MSGDFFNDLDFVDWDFDFDQEPVPTRRELALASLAKFGALLARLKRAKAKPQAPDQSNSVTGNCNDH